MKYFSGLFLLSILIFTTKVFPQQNTADSLVKQLDGLSGNEKVDVFSKLSDIYQYIHTKSAIDYALQGIALASEINYEKGLAGCYGSLGYCYVNLDNEKALTFTQKALDIRLNLNDKPGIATSLNVLGVIYYYKGDYLTSIENHLEALKLREEVGDEIRIATSYNNISLVYLALEDYETALEYLNKALKVRIQTNNKRGIGIIKDNIGSIYSRIGNYDKAFEYLNDALKVNKEIGNTKSLANSHYNLAKNYRALNDKTNAFKHFNLALAIYMELDEKHGIAITENGIASLYIEEWDTDFVIKHALIALENAELVHSLDNIATAADILQTAYEKEGDYKNGYKYLSLYKNVSDSLKITEKIKKLAKIEFDYKVKKIKEEQEVILNKQNILIIFLSVTLLLFIIIVVLIVGVNRNKKKMNIKLNKLNSKLEELNSAKDRFFSIIAHDLRGPFQSLLGYSEILDSEIDKLTKKEIKDYSKSLNKSIQKQFELLNDLLDWSRMQNENFKFAPETISLKKELCDLTKPLTLTALQKEIKLIIDIDENFTVFADKNMLRLVMRNLISNGIKFTGKNGFVKISAFRKEKYDEIIISDNGVGLAEDDQEKLFRIDVNHSTKGTSGEMGTGLGLILCKEIIEKHSGEIKVESEEGKGSIFSFTLMRSTS